jgi:hypothetical protein
MPGFQKFYANIAHDIEQSGRSIVGVLPSCEPQDDGFIPFAYTVGNFYRRLPELLVIGVANAGFLNTLSEQMITAGRAFANGQIILLPEASLPVKVIYASDTARTEYAVQAGEYLGDHDYPIMQVLIPAPDGKFPGEPGCQPPYSNVPVLWRS